MAKMQTVFDSHVDDALIGRALAPATFGSMWLDPALLDGRPDYPALTGPASCDLLWSAAGTPDCGRRCTPPNAIPVRGSC